MFGNKLEAKIDGNGNIVIQEADNSTITINMNNPEEVSKALINLNDRLSQLPLEMLRLMEEKRNKEVPVIGANVYLTQYVIVPNGGFGGYSLSVGVSITSTTKDIRYFNEPFFKTSEPISENGLDTFIMTDKVFQVNFPQRLEYGQPISVQYHFNPNNELLRKLVETNPKATIVAVVTTTLGETYYSNEYEVSKLFERRK